ncbi:hypothetical protein QUR95_00450 [Candidatus Nasuia deltocephalinicola]|nr:hypothetical protein QUR95_00450 [Candidatus Nasuia deltocephalinicola]
MNFKNFKNKILIKKFLNILNFEIFINFILKFINFRKNEIHFTQCVILFFSNQIFQKLKI